MIASITFKYLEQGRCTGIALIFSQWFPWRKRIILFGTRGRRFCTCKFLCLHVQPCPLHVQFARATFPLLVRRDCLARANICCLLVQRDVCTCKLPHRKKPAKRAAVSKISGRSVNAQMSLFIVSRLTFIFSMRPSCRSSYLFML